MAPTAADTLILGMHGEIQAGETIPPTWTNHLGQEFETDFARLEDLGLVAAEAVADELEKLDGKALKVIAQALGLEVKGNPKLDDLRALIREREAAVNASHAAIDAAREEQRPLTADELAVLTDKDFETAVEFTRHVYPDAEQPAPDADRQALTEWILAQAAGWQPPS